MSTTREEIESWFDEGVAKGSTHMVVVCDTFDHEDYPIYVYQTDKVQDTINEHSKHMQKVMEVYNLKKSKEDQLKERRAYNV